MRVAVVVGTRPESIKMSPVVAALRARGVETTVVSSGQHPALVAQALAAFDLAPDVSLPPVRAADLGGRLGALVTELSGALAALAPAVVLVHGDTTTTLAAALAAHHARIPVGHVEAGLRTGDRAEPFPEEDNRRLVDHLSTHCFAPTDRARRALRAEGIPDDRILVVGNPLVDAVRATAARVGGRSCAALPGLESAGLDELGPVVLVTVHRRESWGDPLQRICGVVERLPARVLWPVHPSPEVAPVVRRRLAGVGHVRLVEPLPYQAMVRALLRADLVLTDSGGIQEEGAILGTPTLVLRRATERPEALASGVVRLVGTAADEVADAALRWLRDRPAPAADGGAFGDGHAGERIAAWVVEACR